MEPTRTGGLTAAEASHLLESVGPNTLPHVTALPIWRQFLGQFVHFFAIMLWVAAGLAVVGGLPQLAVAIVAVVIVNGVFAFVQEYRAERAANRLRDLLPTRTTVVRSGVKVLVDAAEVVPGIWCCWPRATGCRRICSACGPRGCSSTRRR